jgi:hypothetical protein
MPPLNAAFWLLVALAFCGGADGRLIHLTQVA